MKLSFVAKRVSEDWIQQDRFLNGSFQNCGRFYQQTDDLQRSALSIKDWP
jgi:hypothetical protein